MFTHQTFLNFIQVALFAWILMTCIPNNPVIRAIIYTSFHAVIYRANLNYPHVPILKKKKKKSLNYIEKPMMLSWHFRFSEQRPVRPSRPEGGPRGFQGQNGSSPCCPRVCGVSHAVWQRPWVTLSPRAFLGADSKAPGNWLRMCGIPHA